MIDIQLIYPLDPKTDTSIERLAHELKNAGFNLDGVPNGYDKRFLSSDKNTRVDVDYIGDVKRFRYFESTERNGFDPQKLLAIAIRSKELVEKLFPAVKYSDGVMMGIASSNRDITDLYNDKTNSAIKEFGRKLFGNPLFKELKVDMHCIDITIYENSSYLDNNKPSISYPLTPV